MTRDETLKKLKMIHSYYYQFGDNRSMSHCEALQTAINVIEQKKTAVWKGWEKSYFKGCDDCGEPIWGRCVYYICSNCGRRTVIQDKFCPNCGFMMEKEM